MPTALVLGGGGSLGDFQVGAARYLYDRGLRPSIISGCSVGALSGAKLAENADPMRAIEGLEALWSGLRQNSDMWEEEPWVTALATFDIGQRFANAMSGYFFAPAVGVGVFLYELARDAAEIVEQVERAQAVMNLNPIRRLLTTNLDPNKIRSSGITLRVAMVGLESGNLRYVTESGQVLERDQAARVMRPATQMGEACWELFEEVNALRQSLTESIDGLGPEPVGRLRAVERSEIGLLAKERELQACIAQHRVPFTVQLRDAVVASASIPVAFRPVRLGFESYVDGGVREMLPIEAALDAGADEVIALVTSAGRLPPAVGALSGQTLPSFAQANLADITKRVAEEIMPTETLFAETNPPGGWDARVTVIQPSLFPNIHDLMTIDPGLIRIQMAHGYMRADDVMQARARATQESPGDPGAYLALADEYSEARKTNQLIRLRAAIWDLEHVLHEQIVRGSRRGGRQTTFRPSLLEEVRTMKRDLRRLIDERRRAGGALPANTDQWWQEWEQHSWTARGRGPWEERAATFVRQSVPSRMTAGRRYTVSVTMRNAGLNPWAAGDTNPYRLGSQGPQDNRTWGLNRVEMPAQVAFDGEATFQFSVTAPAQPGSYVFQWRMVQEMVAWFGDLTPAVTVQVAPPRLNVTAQPYPAPLNVSTRMTVSAKDAESGVAISGQVLIDGRAAGSTNVPFDYVFRMRSVRSGPRLEPTIELIAPSGLVRVSGYPDSPIDFGIG